MPLHHLRSREEPWSRKAVRYDTLNIDVLVFAGAPELQEDEPAGSVICVSPAMTTTGRTRWPEIAYTGGSNLTLTTLLSLWIKNLACGGRICFLSADEFGITISILLGFALRLLLLWP